MADSDTVEKATLQAEIKKAGTLCQDIQKALTALEEKNEAGDLIRAFLSTQHKEQLSVQMRMKVRLQKIASPASSAPVVPSAPQPETGGKDIKTYIIHSHKDQHFVTPIMADLKSRGLTVIHPETDYLAGEPILSNIEKFVKQSTRVVAVFSKNSLDSEWVKKEILACLGAQFDGHKQRLVPILLDVNKTDLPLYLQDKHFVDTRVAPYCSSKKALYDRIAKEVFADDIPFFGNFVTGDIATGLAWSYFYGYLKLIIPTFTERLKKSKYWLEEGAVNGNMSERFIVLCPDSGRCHPSLGDSDPRIEALAKDPRSDEGFIEPVYQSRGGTPKRPYKQGVYRIKMKDGETYYVVAEYATPLLSMYEMEEHGLAGLQAEEKLYQKKMFEAYLQEILYRARIDKKVLLLPYDDSKTPDQKYPIADLLVQTIKDEVAEKSKEE